MARTRRLASQGSPSRASWLAPALSLGLLLVTALPAATAVERYQFKYYDINVTSVNGNTAYAHTFTVRHNPCTDTYSGTGHSQYHDWDETLSDFDFDEDANKLSFNARYPNGYEWYPSFKLNTDDTLTFVDGYGSDNVSAATGTYTTSQTNYNHGEYVAENIDEYGEAPQSCIGMPLVSQGKTD